ncbi:MAG: dihydropteroate synthase, partial [Bdellovibrionales bacterium]|nr:dihydropteroate synthase [Bdellovibrionales bacterium]
MNLSHYKGLGVINRTPNSFSDKGLSLQKDYFLNQIKEFLNTKGIIVDVGFESTAPMNTAVSFSEEMIRFNEFLELTLEIDFGETFISFDTYKVESFLAMTNAFGKLHPKVKFIFNDVSGVLDH